MQHEYCRKRDGEQGHLIAEQRDHLAGPEAAKRDLAQQRWDHDSAAGRPMFR